MKCVRVGIAGVGGMAVNIHIPCLKRLPGVEIAALCDRDKVKTDAVAAQLGAKAYADFDEMLAKESLDAVYILTPTVLHAELAVKAIGMGCHVFCEKPPAMNVDELRGMCAAAKDANRLLLFGFNRRYSQLYSRLKVFEKKGRPNIFVIQKVKPPMPWTSAQTRSLGPLILENGIHFIDLARWVCGEIKSVEAGRWRTMDLTDSSNHLSAVFTHEGGARTMLCLSYTAGLNCERTALHGDGFSCFTEFDVRRKVTSFVDGKASEELFPDGLETFGFFKETEDFIACVRDGRPLPFPPEEFVQTLHWAVECVEKAAHD